MFLPLFEAYLALLHQIEFKLVLLFKLAALDVKGPPRATHCSGCLYLFIEKSDPCPVLEGRKYFGGDFRHSLHFPILEVCGLQRQLFASFWVSIIYGLCLK